MRGRNRCPQAAYSGRGKKNLRAANPFVSTSKRGAGSALGLLLAVRGQSPRDQGGAVPVMWTTRMREGRSRFPA